MSKFGFTAFALLLCCGCHHPRTLPESLTNIFSDRLRLIDSAAALDSLHVQWRIPVTEKLGRTFDDSIYVREYTRVEAQLAAAFALGNKDSIEFYEYEIHYMEQEIDSIGRSIGQGDTTHRFGSLVGCTYYISGKMKKLMDSTVVFIDTTGTIRYTGFIDSALRRSVKLLDIRN